MKVPKRLHNFEEDKGLVEENLTNILVETS